MKKYEERYNNKCRSILSRYRCAEAFEHAGFYDSMVLNAKIYPNWIGSSNCFWYVKKYRESGNSSGEICKEFRLIDAGSGSRRRAFDHCLLAQALSLSTARQVSPYKLPISNLKLDLVSCFVTFTAFNKRWKFDPSSKTCDEIAVSDPYWLVSPDRKKAAFLRDYNLWIRDISSGEEHPLTRDGKRYYAYALQPERTSLTGGFGEFALGQSAIVEALWSPNSDRLLTIQTDEREVRSFPVTQYIPPDGSVRPRCVQTKYALPGDKHIPSFQFLSINIETGEICRANYPNVLDSVIWHVPFAGNRVWWSSDSRNAYFVDITRGQKQARVVEFNTQTGATRVLFKEISETFIDLNLDFENPASLIPLPRTNELIWFSERSGWAQLYLYDLSTGVLKNRITHGDWVVREVLHFDPEKREVFIQIAGRVEDRNPYYRELCRVNVDTSEMVILATGCHDYVVHKANNRQTNLAIGLNLATNECSGVSPDGNYIVITRTRVDEIPVTELIDRFGDTVLTVETAEVSGLPSGWRWPEPVKVLAADGKTDIYGVVFRPTDFSPEKQYPIIDWAMTNPFYSYVPHGAFGNDSESGYSYWSAQAFAELGFVTVIFDGRGSCYRSKAFHNESYGKIHKGNNLEDHISGIRQLAERYPYIDIQRVGVTDTCGSNGPVYGMLAYPDFYKVGATVSIWDVRMLAQAEIYQGLKTETGYQEAVLGNLAGNLVGNLLIIQCMMDPFFTFSGALQLVDALIRKNKIFDMVILPNGVHAWSGSHYALRRIWDYLVCNLHGINPPEFQLCSGLEFAMEKLHLEME